MHVGSPENAVAERNANDGFDRSDNLLLQVLRGMNDRDEDVPAAMDDVNKVKQTESLLGGGSGVTYTRWGRKTCPTGAELVYEGTTVGSHYSHAGGGANYLCLPQKPDYDTTAKPTYQSYLYGAEYEFYGGLLNSVTNHEAPCAVCYVSSRSTKLMYPAKTTCPSSWTTEYSGYLVAGYFGHARSAVYECLDKQPESVYGSHLNHDGANLYFVQNTCHGIKCPPYQNLGVVTCSVCTR